jgi:hypothetical protein
MIRDINELKSLDEHQLQNLLHQIDDEHEQKLAAVQKEHTAQLADRDQKIKDLESEITDLVQKLLPVMQHNRVKTAAGIQANAALQRMKAELEKLT